MKCIDVQNLTKSFGERVLFENVQFSVMDHDHIGLIGANGTGKTTLFRLLCEKEDYDSGQISCAAGVTLGYLEQYSQYDPNRTLYDETLTVFSHFFAMEQRLREIEQALVVSPGEDALIREQARLNEQYQAGGGLTMQSRTRAALLGMGFTDADMQLPMHALSGGQHAKAQMAKLLLSGSNILLLDEPTNHLDIPSCEWLEQYLLHYDGAFLVISHDRYFLDRVTNRTFELENQAVTSWNGNYSQYMQAKAAKQEQMEREYKNTSREIARMETMISQLRSWNREKSIKTAESKEKALAKLKQTVQKPTAQPQAMRMNLQAASVSGNDVLAVSDVAKSFDKPLFSNVQLDIKRGERVFLLGPNGCGKTTLFQILLHRMMPDQGEVRLGANVQIGSFDQSHGDLNWSNTALDEVWDAHPALTQTQVRSAMAAFLFRGEEVFQPISSLSGGERARVALLKLMLSNANFLLLDEPTNHLDAVSREVLEEALGEYGGTMLCISHDRFFINRLATRICLLTPNGLVSYLGNYDEYLAARALETAEAVQTAPAKKPNAYKEQREKAAALRRQEGKVRRAEEAVEALEQQIDAMEQQLASEEISTDYQKAMALSQELDEKKRLLEAAMEQWEQESLLLMEMQE